MKYPLTSILLFTFLYARSQEFVRYKLPMSPDSTIIYEKIVNLDSTYKSQILYTASKTWFVNAFKTSKSVIQSEDQLSGRIIGKFTIPGGEGAATGILGSICEAYIQLDVKEGKYRYRIYGFNGNGYVLGEPYQFDINKEYMNYLHGTLRKGALLSKRSMYDKCYKAYESFDNRLSQLIASLNQAMKNSKSDSF